MELKQLQALLAVAKHGSFSVAAEQLHITQPAMTKRIQQLETATGTTLIDRHHKDNRLTDAGELVSKLAQQFEQAIHQCHQQIADLSDGVKGHLRLAISHHLGLHRLPKVLQAYSKLYPLVELEIEFTDSEKAHDAMARSEFDLAIVTLSPTNNAAVNTRVVWPDPLTVVTANDHPLTRIMHPDIASLASYPAVIAGPDTYTGQIVTNLFRQHNLSLNVAMTTNYLETVSTLVAIGQGWSILPQQMVHGDLTAVEVKGLRLQRDLGIVTHPNKPLSNAAKALVELLIAQQRA